jgi:membrane-associated phospholipid phosphatase
MDWELNFMTWGHGWWTSPFLDQVIPWLTHLGSHVVVVFLIVLSSVLTRQKKILGRLVILYALQSAVVYGLKYLIQRPRPPILWTLSSGLSRGPGEILDPSFPSAHTLYAFMMATFLADWFLCCRGICGMDANLPGRPLPHRCDRWRDSGLRIDEAVFGLRPFPVCQEIRSHF